MKVIQFVGNVGTNSDEVTFKGVPNQELVEELGLCQKSKFNDGSGKYYVGNIDNILNAGWELIFVTSIGEFSDAHQRLHGELVPLYVFKKA